MSLRTRLGRALALLVPFVAVAVSAAESSVVVTATRLSEEIDDSLAPVTAVSYTNLTLQTTLRLVSLVGRRL